MAELEKKENIVSEQSASNEHSIDFSLISQFEGGNINKGYVPDPVNSKSGVTIAIGFDLGARNTQDLRNLHLSSDLIRRLEPYLGLQSMKAADFIEKHPLTITDADADAINRSVKAKMIDSLISKYNDDSSMLFHAIPAQWQTVIASVEFQYGSVQKRCPNFWRCVTSQNWPRAISELRNFGDGYPSRRNKEADYAEQYS